MDGACSQGSLCLVSLPYLRSRASHRTTSVPPTLHLSIPSFLDQYKMQIVAHSHIHPSDLLFLLLWDGITQSLPWMQSLPLFVLVCGRLHASIPPRRSYRGPTTNQRKTSRSTRRTKSSQTRRSARTTRTTTTRRTDATSTSGARTDTTWITRTCKSQEVDLARSTCMHGSISCRLRPSFYNTNHTFG